MSPPVQPEPQQVSSETLRVLMITQALDLDDDLLGVTVAWTRELAARVRRLDVLALRVGKHELAPDAFVSEVGSRAQASVWTRAWRFHRAVSASAARGLDVIFVHMCPEYVLAAYPVAWRHRIPTVLWFSHKHVPPQLRLCRYTRTSFVTTAPEAFRLPGVPVRAIGSGIDTRMFTPSLTVPGGGRRFVSVGRVAPVKEYHVLVEAIAILKAEGKLPTDVQFDIVGRVQTKDEVEYHARLLGRLREFGESERVGFLGSLPYHRMPEVLRRSHFFVNLTPPGSFDKAVLEAMSCGLPALTPNFAMFSNASELCDKLVYRESDPRALAEKIAELLAIPAEPMAELRQSVRAFATTRYSIASLVERLLAVFEEVVAPAQEPSVPGRDVRSKP